MILRCYALCIHSQLASCTSLYNIYYTCIVHYLSNYVCLCIIHVHAVSSCVYLCNYTIGYITSNHLTVIGLHGKFHWLIPFWLHAILTL